MKRSRAAAALAAVLVLAGAAGGGSYAYRQLHIDVPDYAAPGDFAWLDQNWQEEERHVFHHAGQGTQTLFMPYAWFLALEQPSLSFGSPGLFSDQRFLDRFGFIPDAGRDDGVALPVGFARGLALADPSDGSTWNDLRTGAPLDGIGFTCAACHTGRLAYRGLSIAIDGGPALTNIGEFQKALGLSLLYLRYVPGRLDRFAARVLGSDPSPAERDTMTAQLDAVLAQLKRVKDSDEKVASHSVAEGFGRLDALNRIGNQVFSLDLDLPENYSATSAPVNYPHVWGSSWFDWVQYNGSIEQPMVRNAGEALGVRALVNLTSAQKPLYDSTVRIDNLYKIEQMLAGPAEPDQQCTRTGQQPPKAGAYKGLKAPPWPGTILPPIKVDEAERGHKLYAELCQGCHLPPVGTPAFCDKNNWTKPNAAGKTFIKLPMVDVATLGTDPAQAADMQARAVTLPPALGITDNGFGPALGQAVEKTVLRWYDAQDPPVPQPVRDEMDGFRPNGIRAELAYRARTLDGIWATAPFLHNGSVPTLYALLSPVVERPVRFQLGQREFDPVTVGYSDATIPGGSTFDTTIRGNRNTGHEFDDRPGAPGVIGRRLAPNERMDLVEFLKTL